MLKNMAQFVFCTLTDEYHPLTRIILSLDDRRIDNLPFGSVPLIRVTPIAKPRLNTWTNLMNGHHAQQNMHSRNGGKT
jgi:hypothetical protein